MCYNISVSQRATAGKERQSMSIRRFCPAPPRSIPTIFGGARHVVTNAYITITAGRDERPFAM